MLMETLQILLQCLLLYEHTTMDCDITNKFNAEHWQPQNRRKFHFLASGKRQVSSESVSHHILWAWGVSKDV